MRELAIDGEDVLGFDLLDQRIACRYEPRDARGKKVLSDLRQAVKQADAVYIATDHDREGETIGWHLQQALRLKQPHLEAAFQVCQKHEGILDLVLAAARVRRKARKQAGLPRWAESMSSKYLQ